MSSPRCCRSIDPGHDESLVSDSGARPTTGTVEDLANWTGGAFFYASTPSETSKAARQVIDELREQYIIAFEPTAGQRLAAARNSRIATRA